MKSLRLVTAIALVMQCSISLLYLGFDVFTSVDLWNAETRTSLILVMMAYMLVRQK